MTEELKALAGMVAVIVMVCIGGTVEYQDTVLGSMDEGTYEALKEKLGEVSTGELVEAYVENQEYWDSVGRMR